MRDEPLHPGLFEEALLLLRRAALEQVEADEELDEVLARLARALPALRAQDWRHHGAQAVER